MTGKPILILVLSLFAFCLGDPDCSPRARCNDLWKAKECNAVKECIKEWSNVKLPVLEDDVCSICLEMVKEARDTLRDNTTRELLKEVFEGSCSLLTLKPAVKYCDELVDQFVPELVDILSSQMDPQVVCSVAKLCNNAALRASQKESSECTECQSFMHTSEIYMRDRVSPENFKNGMLEVCRSAGSFSDVCSHLGIKHANFLYGLLKSVLEKEPCEATLVCPVMPNATPSVPTEIRSDALCSSCNNVMSNLRHHLLRAKTPERFAENVLKICKKLNLSNGACSKMASPEFYEKLKGSETLPKLFCQASFCREKSLDVPVWPLVSTSDQRVDTDFFDFLTFSDSLLREDKQREAIPTPRPTISYGDAIVNPMFFGPLLSSKLYTGNKEECDTCNEVLQILSEPVRHDDDYLNKMFDVVCIGVKNQEACKRFISKFSPFLMRAFAEGGVSKELCVDLVPSCQVKRSELTPPQSCNLCLNVMKVLKRGNSTHLGPFLEEECSKAVGTPRYICKDLSSTFENLASLLQTSTEREACSFVKLCDSTSVEIEPVSKPSCQTCMLTIQSLADVLKNNNSDDVISSVLDSLCDLLPHVEKKLCYNLVKMVGVEGFKKLVENINPSEICKELHICKRKEESQTTSTTLAPIPTAVTGGPGNRKVPCKFCMMAVKMLLDQLQDDKTEDAIRKALDNVCQYFPEETRDTCRNLIDQYAEDLIDMIIADFNATEICTYLKLCPTQHLIGGDGHDQNRATFDVNTNEVRDWFEPQEENKTVTMSKQIEEAFRQFHKVVQECAMCEALVGVITSHRKMLVKDYDFSSNAYKICSIVPKDKVKMCTSMIVSYGPSIVNLILDHHIEPNEICVYLDLCSEQMQAKVNQPVSVPEPKVVPEEKNDCMLGPVFWCANAENAEKCGTFLHCQETVWKSWKSPPTRRSDNL